MHVPCSIISIHTPPPPSLLSSGLPQSLESLALNSTLQVLSLLTPSSSSPSPSSSSSPLLMSAIFTTASLINALPSSTPAIRSLLLHAAENLTAQALAESQAGESQGGSLANALSGGGNTTTTNGNRTADGIGGLRGNGTANLTAEAHGNNGSVTVGEGPPGAYLPLTIECLASLVRLITAKPKVWHIQARASQTIQPCKF